MMPTSYPRSANTAATLAAIPIPIDQPIVRMTALLTGTGGIGDGNGGAYYWDYGSTATEDGFNYIASSNALYAAAGRWIRFPMVAPTPGQASAPVFSPANSSFSTTVTVSLTSATVGAAIYYTVNGGAEILYTVPFVLSATSVLTAIARMTGLGDSDVTNKTYTKVAAPTFVYGFYGRLFTPTAAAGDINVGPVQMWQQTPTNYDNSDSNYVYPDPASEDGPYCYYGVQNELAPAAAADGFFVSFPLNPGDLAQADEGYTLTDANGWPYYLLALTFAQTGLPDGNYRVYRLLNQIDFQITLRVRQ